MPKRICEEIKTIEKINYSDIPVDYYVYITWDEYVPILDYEGDLVCSDDMETCLITKTEVVCRIE